MLHKRYPEQFPEEYLVTAFFCHIAGEWNDTINNREMSMAMVANDKKATEFRKGKIRKFTNIYIRMKLHKRQGKKHPNGYVDHDEVSLPEPNIVQAITTSNVRRR